MPKQTKKVATKRRKTTQKRVVQKGNPSVLSAIVVVASLVLAPFAFYLTGSYVIALAIPAVASLVVAFMYKEFVGLDMNSDFRRETTTMVAVFGVIIFAFVSVKYPAYIDLRYVAENVEPIFMLFFRSLWVIIAASVTVFLPLSVTTKK